MKIITLLLSIALLSGCATNYVSQYYRDHTAGVPKDQVDQRLMPYSGVTKIFSTNDHQRDGAVLAQRGYVMVGESGFEGGVSVTDAQLMEQGKKVGADIVLYSSKYQGSSQTAVPFMQYHPGQNSTTYSSGTANASAYGTGGSAYGTATYSGTSTTTSPGTFSTTMVPVTVHRYSYGVTFWRKERPAILGVQTDVLPEEMRRQLQRNTGALVKVVMDDSPAFRANILAGDVVIAVDDTPIISPQQFHDTMPQFSGKRVVVTILRGGEEKKIEVQMNTKL